MDRHLERRPLRPLLTLVAWLMTGGCNQLTGADALENVDEKLCAAPTQMPTCTGDLILIAGGCFEVVLPGGVRQDAVVSPFCLSKHEVDQGAFADWCGTDPVSCDGTAHACEMAPVMSVQGPDAPMNCVPYLEAAAYCAKLGGSGAVIPHLPTIQQWQWAARSGALGRRHPWEGNAVPTGVCYQQSKPCDVTAYASSDVTADGIEGLAAGLSEWTSTPDAAAGKGNVVLGGNFRSRTLDELAWDREPLVESTSGTKHDWLGFRCALY